MRSLRTVVMGGVGIFAYSLMSARSYRLRAEQVPIRGPGPSWRVLHLSDLHLSAGKRKLIDWLRALPEAAGPVDLVLATGDLIDDDSGIAPLCDVFERIEARHGRYYVLGSHDYFQSTLRGLMAGVSKLYAARRDPVTSRPADTEALEEGLRGRGWVGLANTSDVIPTEAGPVRITGLDDPFLKRHNTDHIRRDPGDALAIGIVHSPDVVSDWALVGYDLILAGHTHGGQVRAPVVGALVTNCTLPAALASGLHRIGSAHLHVSPGLGTSKFAPIRFLCPPEATVLELRPGGVRPSRAPDEMRR
jgi:predicted MPP superfamily phosphohydrolase